MQRLGETTKLGLVLGTTRTHHVGTLYFKIYWYLTSILRLLIYTTAPNTYTLLQVGENPKLGFVLGTTRTKTPPFVLLVLGTNPHRGFRRSSCRCFGASPWYISFQLTLL